MKRVTEVSIKELGKYPDISPAASQTAKEFTGDGNSDTRNPLFPNLPKEINRSNARAAVQAFVFPSELKTQAMRSGARLAAVFDDVARMIMTRDHTSGKLNRAKLPDVVQATLHNTYDENKIRPYRRAEMKPAKRPHIVVVASASTSSMWSHKRYIPNALELALSIQWACESAGLQATAAMTREIINSKGWFVPVIIGDSQRPIPLSQYAPLFQRDLYRIGWMSWHLNRLDIHDALKAQQGYSYNYDDPWNSLSAYSGGDAVAWARNDKQADIVIAIGNVRDARNADIVLSGKPSQTVSQALDMVIATARKFK
ncbi:MAG: hypothetical protein KC496_03605 [Anaerolineae bacterium]|nr:hypothetical protein [Anaerolineae bacterium]